MTKRFLDLPQRGKTEAWRYFVGLFLVFLFWFLLGSLPTLGLASFVLMDGNPDTAIDLTTGLTSGISPLLNFLVLMTSFWFLIFGLWLVVRLLHKRPFLTLITPLKQIRWRRAVQGFAVYLGLVIVASLVEYALHPDIYIVTFNLSAFLPFLLLMLILIPIQTLAEELFFRGYLLQIMGHGTRNTVILTIVNGILFMLPHLTNPEVANGPILLALYYFGIGCFLALITLKDNGLELALGAHAANNLFSGIFVNYADSVLQTESVFTVSELDPLFSLVTLVVTSLLFYLILRPGNDTGVKQVETP